MTSGRNLALVCGLGATWLLVACGTSADSGGADQPDGSLSDATSGGDAAGGDASRPGNDAAAGSSGSGGGAGDAAAPDGRAGGGSSGAGSSGSGGSGSGSGGASSSGTSSSSGASGSGGPDGSATGGGDGSAPPASADVLQHHKNATRDGVFADDAMTAAYAGSLRLDATFAPAITGDVYAQPLYVTDGPVRSQEAFIVATEANHVTAVDATGVVLWDRTFGTPAAANNKP
ncbi:MAG TPA: hypothetical protein VE987_13400, partial [Polyangiaceae bacterium]|nr:hypothetical protein [Polyangiaceae bacterium]